MIMSVPVKTTSTLAIISLVAGILGWTLLPLLGSVGAIITGHMARGEIRKSAGTIDGDGLALAGLVLGWGSVIVTILGVLLAVMFFGGIAALLAWLGFSGQLG
jgi:Domain of unknown function (DUF4190)